MKRRLVPQRHALWLICIWIYLYLGLTTTGAFSPVSTATTRTFPKHLFRVLQQSASSESALPDIDTMKLKDIRQELESYGISTRSFLEKPEFVEALKKARAEGKQPKKKTTTTDSSSRTNGEQASSGKSRDERIQEEMVKAKSMSVADLRKELTSRGIKTNAFFEKSEFVKAYAEAIVDGVKAKSTSGGSRSQQEEYDPSYRDVTMKKMDPGTRQMLMGRVIDVRAN